MPIETGFCASPVCISLLKHALKLKRHTIDPILLMMYPARGGLDWGQRRRGVLSEVRGSIPARGSV